MSDIQKVMTMIKEHDVKYVDFRFTDPRGKWQHLAHHIRTITEDFLAGGVMFDGSSIAGWKAINESDMVLMPDCKTAVLDPFAAQTSLIIFCDTHEPLTGQPYGRDPRSLAKKAEAYLASTGIGDKAYFGPEAEFFIFDDVRYKTGMNGAMLRDRQRRRPLCQRQEISRRQYRPSPADQGRLFPGAAGRRPGRHPRRDALGDGGYGHRASRSITTRWRRARPSSASSSAPLVECADHMQIYKYVVHNVAHQYGKTATFMPKPIKGDNGSGMHVHQSLWKGGKPLFAGSGYADLSDMALHYIGGIIKHAKAINAFTNPTTNSYKRLIPGFEAPVLLAYSARNRSASCRIPIVSSPKAQARRGALPRSRRQSLSGLRRDADGRARRHPEQDPSRRPDRQEPLRPPARGAEGRPDRLRLARARRSRISRADHAFLLKGDVFSKDLVESLH